MMKFPSKIDRKSNCVSEPTRTPQNFGKMAPETLPEGGPVHSRAPLGAVMGPPGPSDWPSDRPCWCQVGPNLGHGSRFGRTLGVQDALRTPQGASRSPSDVPGTSKGAPDKAFRDRFCLHAGA